MMICFVPSLRINCRHDLLVFEKISLDMVATQYIVKCFYSLNEKITGFEKQSTIQDKII